MSVRSVATEFLEFMTVIRFDFFFLLRLCHRSVDDICMCGVAQLVPERLRGNKRKLNQASCLISTSWVKQNNVLASSHPFLRPLPILHVIAQKSICYRKVSYSFRVTLTYVHTYTCISRAKNANIYTSLGPSVQLSRHEAFYLARQLCNDMQSDSINSSVRRNFKCILESCIWCSVAYPSLASLNSDLTYGFVIYCIVLHVPLVTAWYINLRESTSSPAFPRICLKDAVDLHIAKPLGWNKWSVLYRFHAYQQTICDVIYISL